MQYSPELIQRTKQYFAEKYGETLSYEEVTKRLNTLCELHQAMATASALEGDEVA